MGCNGSKISLIPDCAGDGKQFLERFEVDKVLGEGEFGVVKLVHSKKNVGLPSGSRDGKKVSYACKMLRKGMHFKDNVLYSPIKPHTLQTECEILRTLNGKHYNVKLIGIYESPSTIFIVTDFCAGGDMMEYISACYSGEEEGLTTDDVSRMSFQLLDAISYCAKFGIMHRDIKPENIMFKSKTRGAALQLIDFGSGSIESLKKTSKKAKGDTEKDIMTKQADGSYLMQHTTYAGTAFYISPEMFRNKYTCKTDVWSVGVTLYVLVSGYPADDLQKAFNRLQDSGTPESRKDMLRQLPNIPSDMPESYYDMLEMCLTYHHRKRMPAEKIVECAFPQLHKHITDDDTSISNQSMIPDLGSILTRTTSFIIEGLSSRHSSMMQYKNYERAISTLLATMLKQKELSILMYEIDTYIDEDNHNIDDKSPEDYELLANKKRLQVITVDTLISILSSMKFEEVRKMIVQMPMTDKYNNFSYHIGLLRQFVTVNDNVSNKKKTNYDIDYGSDLDNSISRKFRFAMTKINKNFPSETDHSISDFSLNDNDTKLERQHSTDGTIWNSIKKTNSKSNLRKMHRNASVPKFTGL